VKEITLTLESVAHRGQAIAHYGGEVVFVPLGIPGEIVLAQVYQRRRGVLWAQIRRVIEPSPWRVEPRCSYFGECGGCHWQHVAYERQLFLKQQIVRDQLRRIGGIQDPPVRPTVGMANPWRYRNRVRLHVGQRGKVGYFAMRSHEVIEVTDCPIAHPSLRTQWPLAEELARLGAQQVVLRCGVHTSDRLVLMEGGLPAGVPKGWPDDVNLVQRRRRRTSPIVIRGKGYMYESLLGRKFRISALSFFQNNTIQTEKMIQLATGAVGADDGILLDAYSGVGTFSLLLAKRFSSVIGIEQSSWAIADALANARERHVRFVQGAIERVLGPTVAHCDVLLLDPPRVGCSPKALQSLLDRAPRKIIYISCDPATLARDIARIRERGYILCSVQPIDLFPQTFHIEALAVLQRPG